MVAALHGLTRLKDLTLFMKVDVVTPVNIEDLFPVFSRLDRLSVGGPWITNEREQNQLSIESRASAVGELNESSLSWEVKELNVNGRLLSLARHCPILKSLSTTTESILKSWGTVPYTPRHLSRCLQLEELKLSCLSAAREFLDTATLLPALRKLKVLSLQVITPEGLDFLNSSTGLPVDLSDTNNASNDAQRIVDDRALDRILVMPMLETLSVICSHCAPGDHNRMQVALGKFFMSRTRLKSIYLGNVYINPLHIFAQPGMELERGWACTTLETITLKLPGPFKYTGMTLEEQRAEMSSTYRQFGCLSQLQMLSIECDSLFSFHDPAILQLKGATKLRKLSLTLVKGWTYEGVAVLLEAVPGLRVLSLSLVLPGDHVLVKGWLKELGRPDLILSISELHCVCSRCLPYQLLKSEYFSFSAGSITFSGQHGGVTLGSLPTGPFFRPIPRLFVILPDSYEAWDPRSFMTERFRLYFLCECGDHCKDDTGSTASSGQLTIAAATPTAPTSIPVKSTIHLAKHEGYELSRPNEFFDRYGPYILGMLRVLKHCLAVATVVAPAVALADSGVKDIMDGVKSLPESTMEAVDVSINFLEQKLDDGGIADDLSGTTSEGQDINSMFENLAALEGADLRRLDSFLRNKDTDKILGNLYRITTETGYVKWVCLDHYRQVYRETVMASFLQCVEANSGTYDPQLGKVTVVLKSSTAAKDFFSRLSLRASFVIALKVSLLWAFASGDIAMLVEKIAQSNVQDLELDLQCFEQSLSVVSQLRPGKGRYHSLLSLLSNSKLKNLTFANSLHFLNRIRTTDDLRLASIITHCSRLVDLRLGSFDDIGDGVPNIDQVIGSLSELKSLYRINLYSASSSSSIVNNNSMPYGAVPLRELVDTVCPIHLVQGVFSRAPFIGPLPHLKLLYLFQNAETDY
ncbi:hypothetical protein EC991_002923 [Linnemannia zychae]|nr:hypothetical protein EC991_002923 [Linnemannia zychae]